MIRKLNRLCLAVSLSAGSILPVAASGQALRSVRDPRGFKISVPAGWTVEVTSHKVIRANGPDGVSSVLACPVLMAHPVTAEELLRSAPSQVGNLWSRAKVGIGPRNMGNGAVAAGSLSFATPSGPARGAIMTFARGRSGMIYAISAPLARYLQEKPVLLKILHSLIFVQPVTTSIARSAPPRVRLSYKTWNEPREGAFRVQIPVGWKVVGGITHRNAMDPRETIDVFAPGNTAIVRIGDATIPGCVPPSPMLNMTGITEGKYYNGGGGVSWLVARLETGTQFAVSYLRQKMTSPFQNLQITGTADIPGLARTLQNQMNVPGGFMNYAVSLGRADFTVTYNGRQMVGRMYGEVILSYKDAYKLWAGIPMGYVAIPSMAAAGETALEHAVGTWATNPAWSAKQGETAVRAAQIITKSNAEISSIMTQSARYRENAMDNEERKFDNVILGVTDVRNSETGAAYKVEAGHNYYWGNAGGTVVGTKTDTMPNIDFTPLEQY